MPTPSSTPCLRLLLSATLLAACANRTVDAPPPLEADPIDNLTGCVDLRRGAVTVEDWQLSTDDGPAGCADDTLECVLDMHPDLMDLCEPEQRPVAICNLARWTLLCETPPRDTSAGGSGGADAGTAAGGPASGAGAPPSR